MTLLYLNSNKMGEGDSLLGEKLMIVFLEKILLQSIKIDTIICVNSAAYLTTVNDKTVSILSKIEEKGTVISTCGTCLDFFEIRNNLRVGDVGSMDLIVKLKDNASKIINP